MLVFCFSLKFSLEFLDLQPDVIVSLLSVMSYILCTREQVIFISSQLTSNLLVEIILFLHSIL